MTNQERKRVVRVFIDSSVLVAAAISNKGYARDLLIKGFQNEVDLYISDEVVEESERNIKLKAPFAIRNAVGLLYRRSRGNILLPEELDTLNNIHQFMDANNMKRLREFNERARHRVGFKQTRVKLERD